MIYTGEIATIALSTEELIKMASIFALSTVKFFIMLFSARPMGLSFFEAFLIITSGGLFGVISFYYLSGVIIKQLSKIKFLKAKPNKERAKKIFTRRNKIIVKLKIRYGLYGLALLTPALLSIPVGVFIIRKYYERNKMALPIICIAIVLWSLAILGSIYVW